MGTTDWCHSILSLLLHFPPLFLFLFLVQSTNGAGSLPVIHSDLARGYCLRTRDDQLGGVSLGMAEKCYSGEESSVLGQFGVSHRVKEAKCDYDIGSWWLNMLVLL